MGQAATAPFKERLARTLTSVTKDKNWARRPQPLTMRASRSCTGNLLLKSWPVDQGVATDNTGIAYQGYSNPTCPMNGVATDTDTDTAFMSYTDPTAYPPVNKGTWDWVLRYPDHESQPSTGHQIKLWP